MRRYRTSLACIVISVIAVRQASAAAPSFSCSGNLSDTETAICDNDQFARLDNELADVYARALDRARGEDVDRIRDEQKDWILRRNRCRFDRACIRHAYVERLDQLVERPSGESREQKARARVATDAAASTQLLKHNGSRIEMRTGRRGDVLMRYVEVRPGLAAHEGDVLFEGSASDGGKMRGKAYTFKHGCPPAPYEVIGERGRSGIELRGAAPVHAAGSSCKVVDYDDGAPSATLELETEATSASNVIPRFAGKTYYGDARDKMEELGYSPVVPDRSRRECEQENLGREDVCRRWPEVESCAGTGFARCTFLWRRGRTTIEIRTVGDKVEIVDRVSCRTGCPQ
jgi:uncharacterized protein